MKVKNINGTSQNKCKCGSWLQHWKNHGGFDVKYCREAKCTNTDLVGAHVQKAVSTDKSWYIVPLCNSHNQSEDILELVQNTTLVSANKSETCEK